MNMSKSELFSVHQICFANNFFGAFFTTFLTDLRSAFFYTQIDFLKKYFFALISTSPKLWMQMRAKQLKKIDKTVLC